MLQTVTSYFLRMCRSVDALRRLVLMLVLAALAPTVRAGASTSPPPKRCYDIASGDAATTLRQFVEQSGEQVIYVVPVVRGVTTNPVKGEFSSREVIERMVAKTGLTVVEDPQTGALMVKRGAPSRAPPSASPALPSDQPKSSQPKLTESPPVNKRNFLALFAGWLTATAYAQTVPTSLKDDPIVLSPFQVVTDKDNGFAASNAGTATRMSLDMRDVPAPYQVMTREFIDALNITNISEASWWTTNATPILGGDMVQQPSQFNTRGVDNNSGQQRNNYLTAGLVDSYAVERYDFGRGPNAALFNIGANSTLGGGMGAQTKRPRYDQPFNTIAFTTGSWNYMRSTLDMNQPLTKRLAVRANAVWFDRDDYRLNTYERTKGVTVSGAYLITPKTEIRIEGARDRTERNLPPTSVVFDDLSGWDGATVFRGPISDAMLGTQAVPGIPNSFGQILTFQGESQGVNRRSGEYWVWSPFSGQNMLMNYQNEGFTRRADSTRNTPILANGVLYTRGTGLPFGNGAGSQAFTATSEPVDNLNFLYQINLAPDRFNRAIAGSAFRLPDKYFTQAFDSPLYIQDTKDATLTLAHQIGQDWFFELGANVNNVESKTARDGAVRIRNVYIDINQILPNGATNPNYLQPYGDAPIGHTDRNFLNRSIRANLGHRRNLGVWGDYTFNLNAASSLRTTENRTYQYSMANLPDPRMWQNSAQAIRIRQYWNAPSRPYGDTGLPSLLSRNVFSANNSSYTTELQTVKPRWLIADWNDTDEKFDNAVLAVSAKYFGGKLAVLAGERYDRYKSQLFSRQEFGDLPADWDGTTRLYKPAAPADWVTLSYIPRNANTGVPTATKPVPAVTRPRQNPPGVSNNNGVQIYNPFFASDRFRNDYSPPANTGTGFKGTYGLVYHATKHLSLVANYGTSYIPPPTNAFTLDNELARPITGYGYDGGVRLRFFDDRLTMNANYFFNNEDHQRVAPPVTSAINSLLLRNAAGDSSLDGRNVQGLPDIFGSDYQSVRTSGVELEVVGRLTRGWRIMLNVGTAKTFTFNRYPQARVLVPQNADQYRQILEDAGGRLDTTQHPNGAPGLAVINPAVSAAIGSEQAAAVTDYNNIWANYALVVGDQPIQGQKRMSVNAFSDYTIQSGKLKGLRIGLGGQWPDNYYTGTRSADTIVDPADPSRAIDDPNVGISTPIYWRRPLMVTATLGYSLRLRGPERLAGKELSFQLSVKNLLNEQSVTYEVSNVIARPPGGDFTKPNRVSVPASIQHYAPASYLFTTTLKL